MYNGVGLQTARGSGTSGYIQRNKSALTYRDDYGNSDRNMRRDRDQSGPSIRQADKGILEHDRKRKVEVRCMELRDELEDKGLPEDEVEDQVSRLRETLIEAINNPASSFGQHSHAEARRLKPSDVHALSAAKAEESEKWKVALGMRADYEEGQGFSNEYHQRVREERRAAKQADFEAREAAREKRREEYERRRKADEEERREFEEQLRAKRRREDGGHDDTADRRRGEGEAGPSRTGRERERDRADRRAGASARPRSRSRSRSPPISVKSEERDSPPPLPARRRRRDSSVSSRSRSRSRSPAPRGARQRSDSRSRSPPPRRRRRSESSDDSRSRSPPPRRAVKGESPGRD
ncbi:hypothetical protein V8E36_009913 [Tilletia maclaganii]